jgi:hypothetical protein
MVDPEPGADSGLLSWYTLLVTELRGRPMTAPAFAALGLSGYCASIW